MTPQSTIGEWEQLSALTDAEREVYEAVELGEWGGAAIRPRD